MLIIILAIPIAIIYFYIKDYYRFFQKLGYPCVTPSFPFGSFKNVGRTEHISEFMRREYENFKDKGPAFGIYQVFRRTLILTDLEVIKDVLVKRFDIFYSHGIDFAFSNDTLFHSLFFLDGQRWKNMRAVLTPVFSSSKIKLMFPGISKQSDRMIEYIKETCLNKECCELGSIYSSYTTEVIANIAFGLDIECLGNSENEFYKAANTFLNPTSSGRVKALLMISFPKIANIFGMSLNSKETREFFNKVVRDNIEYREKNNIHRNDFFQQMINILHNQTEMTLEEIVANCFLFLLAG